MSKAFTALWATISRYLCFLFYTPRSQVFTPSPRAIPGQDINEEFLSITGVYSLQKWLYRLSLCPSNGFVEDRRFLVEFQGVII